MSAYTESENKRVEQLLEGGRLGDEKPSDLLCQMRQIAGQRSAENFLDAFSSSKYAGYSSAHGHIDLEKIAEVADRIQEVQRPTEACALATKEESSSLLAEIRRLAVEIAGLKLERNSKQQFRPPI